ncbi:nucleotidyltransferase [Ectobacillus sp. SYSU M60031]|uniref:tRNA(Met) cytidine acetate ligase n=1 Tax=Ectobacillus ponti TaxID=2961894 RepID=A0AA41XC88_9BACI|nr:nucleotidyltransferase [Ectobacillus ponti]
MQQAKARSGADIAIAVMSGPFLQRGEPALISRWRRTKMALEGGVDLVVELPYAFAAQKAETFAAGAVSILDALHVDALCFGSESGDITQFTAILAHRRANQAQYEAHVRSLVRTGISYPKAQAQALQAIAKDTTLDVSQPNNILGLHYLQALQSQGSQAAPLTVRRLAAGYHDQTFATDTIASATSIRKQLANGDISAIGNVVPASTLHHLHEYYHTYGTFHDWERYFPLLKYKLLTMTAAQLASIYEAEEGLEHRVLDCIRGAVSFTDLMEQLKTKRYTWTRLQRLCVHILTHTTKEQLKDVQSSPYIRLLGMSRQGQSYLSMHKKKLKLPLVTHAKAYRHPLFELDHKASAVYYSILPEPLRSLMLKQDFVQHPLRYDETPKAYS